MPPKKSIVSTIMQYWQIILLVLGIVGSWYNTQTKQAVQQEQIKTLEHRIEKIEDGKGAMWRAIGNKLDK